MIPADREELYTLAGEYVLGTLAESEVREIEAALAHHPELRRAVAFWQERLEPLSTLAPPADPPPEAWDGIAAQLDTAVRKRAAMSWWARPAPWRWSTAAFAAAAAGLAFYIIAVTPAAPEPRLIAVLHAPQQEPASWVATADRRGLLIQAVAGGTPPGNRAFELWAIAPGSTRPQPVGIIPADGMLRLDTPPTTVRDGATLAISIEPPGGSPTGQPTGAVVFVGALKEMPTR